MDDITLEEFKNIFKEIGKIVNCPICLYMVRPPVKQCKNGHLMCQQCLDETIVSCTICRSKFSKIKLIEIDYLLSILPRACEFGCNYVVKKYLDNEHNNWCKNRIVSCLWQESEENPCKYQCRFKFLRDHLLHNHKIFSANGEHKFITLFYNLNRNTTIIFPLEFQDCLLWNHIKIDIKKKKLLIALQCCPSTEHELDNIFIYKIKSCKGNTEYTYTQKVCKNEENLNESLNNENCIAIPLSICEFTFYEAGRLKYKLEIERFQSDITIYTVTKKKENNCYNNLVRKLFNVTARKLFNVIVFLLGIVLLCGLIDFYVTPIVNVVDSIYNGTVYEYFTLNRPSLWINLFCVTPIVNLVDSIYNGTVYEYFISDSLSSWINLVYIKPIVNLVDSIYNGTVYEYLTT